MTSPRPWPRCCRTFCPIEPPGSLQAGPREKIQSMTHMDIEDINAIGTLLADLKARTEQLRGYL
jgi:hypothetical protein